MLVLNAGSFRSCARIGRKLRNAMRRLALRAFTVAARRHPRLRRAQEADLDQTTANRPKRTASALLLAHGVVAGACAQAR